MWNNPLSYTDPSGYLLGDLKSAVNALAKATFDIADALFLFQGRRILREIGRNEALSLGVSIGIGALCAPAGAHAAAGCAAGFNAAMIEANGGTMSQVAHGAAVAAASSYASGALGRQVNMGQPGNIGASMVVAGSVSKAEGGKFIDGVKGVALTAAVVHIVGEIFDSGSLRQGAGKEKRTASQLKADQAAALAKIKALFADGTLDESRKFKDYDSAAAELADSLVPISKKYNVELGVLLSGDSGDVRYSNNIEVGNAIHVNPGLSTAVFHTHPKPGNVYPSQDDVLFIRNNRKIVKYVYTAGEMGNGSINVHACNLACSDRYLLVGRGAGRFVR